MDKTELKALRKQLGLTQAEIGEKLGITSDAVSMLERGKNNMSRPVGMLAEILKRNSLERD